MECDWSTHNIDTAVWVGKAAFAHAVRTINGNPDPAGPLPPHVASFIQEPSNQDIFGPWASSASLASVSVPQPATRHGHTYGGGRGRGGSAGSEGEGGAGSREGKRRGGSGEGNRTWGPSMGFHSLDRETPGLTEAQQRILNAPKRSTKAPFVTRADLGLEEEAKPAGEEGTSQQPLLAVQEAAARRRRRMATDGIRDKSPDGKMDPDGKKAGDKARKEVRGRIDAHVDCVAV